ncbi:hypothetical protein OF897_18330 [Chryseobacterium formosus]|uniref:PsbP C-terminal domain-containing protein n=1 Tax=Chryseobacterium formosus TaxID=1537363 RepID=A0ABT3XW18_9FLAO|nr:hypothetical protein [Chryseobacterium formosus]MCX8525875.1 hypothetical protein [Chryseobacterium formosus]
MKKILIVATLILCNYLFAQKKYKIEQYVWSFDSPKDYIPKIDQFEKEIKAGTKYLEEKDIKPSDDDVVLLTLEKKDKTSNIIMVSYRDNSSIDELTLGGYAELMKNSMLDVEKMQYPDDDVTMVVEDIVIDKINFKVIRETVVFKKDNHIGSKYFYIADIDGKEFMIVAASVNEKDRKLIDQSILTSTFRKIK